MTTLNPWHKKNDPLVDAVRSVVNKSNENRQTKITEIGAAMKDGTTSRVDGFHELEKLQATSAEIDAATGKKR
tara:strand:- start:513 stop:731 length:219 start_codon:yes stop_codon:yes gene_type:complete